MCIHSFNVIVGYVGGRHYSHSGGAVEIPRRTEIPDGVAGVCLHAAAEKFKGKDRSAGEEPCTGGRSAADHTGVKYSPNHKIV